ncbi:hypothetical protein NDA14_002572 [Ustilago hordei]|nr:hypothetical protein NDA14_002572 [Ustilago hordei]
MATAIHQPIEATATSGFASSWRVLWAFLIGLLATAIFFRSLLPRLPRVLFRGKLRIRRVGIRGIRGIEYRSKGFHNDSAAFSRNGNQLEVKIQRVYASYHVPYFLCKEKDQPCVVPRKSGAIITIHVQGVGVRLPRSQQDGDKSQGAASTCTANQDTSSNNLTLEQQEELRLQELMSSPSMSPSAENRPLFPNALGSQPSPFVASPRPIESIQRAQSDLQQHHDKSGIYRTCHQAGLTSLYSALSLAKWIRGSAIPALQAFLLRAFRAALFILTSSLPVLTSLVSVEIDRIEIYVQEAEAVARIGRAGVTFAMSPDALPSHERLAKTRQKGQDEDQASNYFRAPTWSQFFDAMRMMPTRMGSGARGAASYLVAGMSPSNVTAHLRVDSIDVFEATFKPDAKLKRAFEHGSRQSSVAPSSRPATPLSSHPRADRDILSPTQSEIDLDAAHHQSSTFDESFEWSSRPTRPKCQRSNSASRLSKMSVGSLRGFADRWADWALEPLVESDFRADSGWTRRYLDDGYWPQQLQTIPASARIVSVSGVTELTASLLIGSSFALGGDSTLATKLVLGSTTLGLDAAHRIMCILEERKARRSGWAPTQRGSTENQRSVLSKHLIQQKPSALADALRMVSSLSLSLPSVRVRTTSDAVLSAASSCNTEAEEAETAGPTQAPLPSRELAVALSGFHFELQHSDPKDDLHRRWLGTCGLSKKSIKSNRKRDESDRKPRPRSWHSDKAVEHRRTFLAESSFASFDVRCRSPNANKGSRLLFVGDFSLVARSSWTPFGLFPNCPDMTRLLLAGDPNEHAAFLEASIGGVETDVSMQDLSALLPITNEFSRRRRKKRQNVGIDEPPRPKTDLERLRRLPRVSAGFHIQRISLLLDASRDRSDDVTNCKQQGNPSSTTGPSPRKLTLSVPNVDFVFFGEYRDEYVKRPLAEKRAAYKALRDDNLEWPISGKDLCCGAARQMNALDQIHAQQFSTDSAIAPGEVDSANQSRRSAASPQRYTESRLSIEETIKRAQELEQTHDADVERPVITAKRPSIRETMSKTGKVRLPGYTRKSSMAAETCFSIRYQFETHFRVDAVESFLSLSSCPKDSTRCFLRSPTTESNPSVGYSQHHLLAMHSFEVNGSGRIPGNVEPRSSALCDDVPRLSASDTVAEFRASIEDIDIEAWQPCALDTYTDIALAVFQAKEAHTAQSDDASTKSVEDEPKSDVSRDDSEDGQAALEPKTLVKRLPGGLSVYLSIGHTIAHLGGPDRRIEDQIARGVGFEAERIVLEYAGVTDTKTNALPLKTNWGARTALELTEDVQLQAATLATRHGRVGLARVAMHQAGIFPILDATLATQQHTEGTAPETFAHAKAPHGEVWPKGAAEEDESLDRPATSLLADSVWTFNKEDDCVHKSKQHRPRFRQQDRSNFIFFMPYAAFKTVVRPPQAEKKTGVAGPSEDEVFITSEGTNLLAFKIDLLHTYCILLAFSTFKNLAQRARGGFPASKNKPSSSTNHVQPIPKYPRPSVSCRFDIKEVHTFVTLPKSVRVFVRIRRLEVRSSPKDGLSVSTETIMGAVESPKQGKGDLWEEAVRLRDWKVTLLPKAKDKKRQIDVNGDAGLIRIPYGYAVNPIIDNTSVAIKATKQVVHQFLSGREDSVIVPEAEDFKLLPNISITLRVLTLEAEDDPFETKLNLIWRAGLAENAVREERNVAFAAKVEAISAMKAAYSAPSLHSYRSNTSSDSDDSDEGQHNISTSSHDSRGRKSEHEHVSYDKAKAALDAYNSSSWVRRYTNAKSEQTRRQEGVLKNIYGRFTLSRSLDDLPIKMLPIGKAAPLARSTMYRIRLQVEQAHFPIEQLRDFIHEKGAGMPKDTPYSLVVPMHIKWEMEEWRVTLRDYPMPLLHVPPTHRHETDSRKAWTFEGDIVVAEQLGGPESIRHVPAVIVPAATGHPDAIEYGIVISKVAMTVKMYGTPTVKLRTPFPTRLVWGQSIQPTIQDVMRVIDGITPPPHDPSPKLGFWDKLPLILHGHINFKFEDEGGFNIHMKGSRDPYSIEGQAAGWVKSWKGGVELLIGYDNPEREFFQILSHEYILAIPDLCDYVDHAAAGVLGGTERHQQNEQQRDHDGEGSYHDSYDRKSADASFTSSMHRYMKDPTFRKIVIKLTNGVRWGAGLYGERTCDDETCPRHPKCSGEPFYRECRNFERINHWEVVPKTREHFDSIPESERLDSFRGWRSHHLHFSLSVYSPKNGLHGYGGGKHVSHRDAVNNFYFTPLAWQHFWAWMRLFSSAMSLPIRAGRLFPESPPPSPKFGRFLGTIKYRIDLEPLFITHQYRQFSKEDWARGLRTHVGIKARIDFFSLDMHQRQQETIKDRPEPGGPRIVFHKPFYEAEVKAETIELKTIAARCREDSEMPAAMEDHDLGENMFDDLFAEDCVISDDQLVWIDMNDLVELDAQPIKDPNPRIRMFPALACPQFHYYRKVDSKRERRAREMQDRVAKGESHREGGNDIEELLSRLERSKFGNEHSHVCMVGHNDKPIIVQRKLAQERLRTVRREIDRVLASSDDDSIASEGDNEASGDSSEQLNDLHSRERILGGFIAHLGRLAEHTERVERANAEGKPAPKRSGTVDRNYGFNATDLASMYHDLGTFDNRYVAHNPTLFFSNVTRTLLLKYYYSSRLRRGYAHHMTATAVRYIRDLLKKKDENGRAANGAGPRSHSDYGRTPQHMSPSNETTNGLDILHEMLEDTVNHMSGKDGYSRSGWGCKPDDDRADGLETEMRPEDGISDYFNVAKSNVCLLLKPQVVLRSDVDDKSTVIVTALRTRLQNYTVEDESCAEDSVNAIVLRRNFFALDSLQCYHPSANVLSNALKHRLVSLPLEAFVDMHGHTSNFERIVPHTNATMYYDKFNKLRLSDSSRSVATFRKDGKPVQDHLHHHMDMIVLNCPRFSVSANGEHFAALYNVVTDLILYRDPVHRDHAKRLEEMMFSYDFTDVSGLADIVTALQVRIREAASLVEQYQAVSDRLNDRGRADYIALLGETLELIEELNLIMDAITTSQDSKGGADREKKSALRFMAQAQEVAWNMIGDEAGQLVAKLALRGISFSWLNKADNSAANTLSIQDLQALSVDPNAMFAEIITKHTRAVDHPMAKEGRFLDAMWSVLPPVGGISIVDMFEFNLHPVKIQIELMVGRKIMDYIFGTKRQREKQEEEQKRLEMEISRPENAVTKKSPFARLLGRQKHLLPTSASVLGAASSQTSRRPSTNESSLNVSNANLRSRSASSTDLLSVGRPSSGGSRDDGDADSVSERASTKATSARTAPATAKTSPKSRPGTPGSNSAKDNSNGRNDPNHRAGVQFAIAQRNAAEMRSRASAYRTFVYVKISETIFCLSYKGEKEKSFTDLYDLEFRTPKFEYHNSTFGYVDLADSFKKDVFRAAWNQKSTLLKDIITHRPNRKRNAIESIRAIRQASRVRGDLAVDVMMGQGKGEDMGADRSSFGDGDSRSSVLVQSPTDGGEDEDDGVGFGEENSVMTGEQRGSASDDEAGEAEQEGAKYGHERSGTGQTLAGQIRDAWGRENEIASFKVGVDDSSTPSSTSNSTPARHFTSEVEDLLSNNTHSTPQQPHHHRRDTLTLESLRRFPTSFISRSLHNPNEDSPSTERSDSVTLHSTTSGHSSPYLQLPPSTPSPMGTIKRGSGSRSPSFNLNKLIPKPFRGRTGSNATNGGARRASLGANGNGNGSSVERTNSGDGMGAVTTRSENSDFSGSTSSHH